VKGSLVGLEYYFCLGTFLHSDILSGTCLAVSQYCLIVPRQVSSRHCIVEMMVIDNCILFVTIVFQI
jgi:hypothetical protein